MYGSRQDAIHELISETKPGLITPVGSLESVYVVTPMHINRYNISSHHKSLELSVPGSCCVAHGKKGFPMTRILSTMQLIEDLLTAEETAGPVQDLTDLAGHRLRRSAIDQPLGDLEASVAQLRSRWRKLPPLPNAKHIRWAQAVQRMPSLAFLEIDTDGLTSDADIIRVVLLDKEGSNLYAQTIKPRRSISAKTTDLTAIRQEEVEHAPTFEEVWDSLSIALQGRYILSFNLPFDLDKLRENAERCGFEPIAVIGACLMLTSQHYFHQSSYPKLADQCQRIGFPLPDHPMQNAWDRARGQIHLLEAMAHGITFAQQDTPEQTDTDEEEKDDYPF